MVCCPIYSNFLSMDLKGREVIIGKFGPEECTTEMSGNFSAVGDSCLEGSFKTAHPRASLH